ncbi:hypothetical protein [Lactococcus garvieae]|uniref:hypothetical protein n=1 Tax=Lactococcus garvieae TaxID=1363 RepID=UPI00254EE7F9|nr:hypothetical protein [Lactococcus garvieae]
MTKPDYSDIVKKNEAVRRFMKFGRSKNGKIKVTVMKHAVIVKTSEKGFMINKAGLPVKMTVSTGFVECYQVKEEIKRVHKNLRAPEGVRLLGKLVEKDIREIKPNLLWDEWHRFWAYETLYEIAFSRGVRHERQRIKQRDNIGALTGNDMNDLAEALSIDINKLNTAVLELTASRKAV